ncbi:MAG: flavodoxin domain-containing protein [Candidatus Thorarchaeota archaeon]|jgi:menaquinone-dependent protoporphyrinogen IX oxidase
MNVLIAFGTRKGATADTARVIAEILRDDFAMNVEILDLKKDKKKRKSLEIENYDVVFVGSSIVMGKWTKEAKSFLKTDFGDCKIIVFISAAGTCGKAVLEEDWETYNEYVVKYIDDVVESHSIAPFSRKAFGGRITMFGNTTLDNWNREHIVEWISEIGEILASAS